MTPLRPRGAPRPRRGFTLLELIVVLVVLAVLAALAIPTFAEVVGRSQDSTTKTTLSAMLRDVRAQASFNDGTSWDQAVTTTAGETAAPAALAVPVVAAGTYSATKSTTSEPTPGSAVYAVSSDSSVVVLSLRSPSGRVCVGATSASATTTPTCYSAQTGTANTASRVLSGDVGTLPGGSATGSTVATTVTNLTALGGDTQATLSWTAPSAGATGYTLTWSPGNGSLSLPASATSRVVSGLTNNTTYTFTLTPAVASGTAGPASASARTSPLVLTLTAGSTVPRLSWSSLSGATYTLTRSTSASMTSPTTLYSGTATSYTDSGLTVGTAYYYAVSASASGTVTPGASVVSTTPVSGPWQVVSNDGATLSGSTLSWTFPGDTVANSVTLSPVTTNGSAYSVTFSNLKWGETYTRLSFRCEYTDASGSDNWSSNGYGTLSKNSGGFSLSSVTYTTTLPSGCAGAQWMEIGTGTADSAANYDGIARWPLQ